MGALWIDTSAAASPVSSAYFPAQTPPATGFGSFTDGAGVVWVSMNASPWRMAREVLSMRVFQNTSQSLPAAPSPPTQINYDTIDWDVYGMWSMTTHRATVPIAGRYQMTIRAEATGMASGNCRSFCELWKNGTGPDRRGIDIMTGPTSNLATTLVTLERPNTGDYFDGRVWNNPAGSTATGFAMQFFEISYLGPS
jgi:hypothetical protein